MNKKDCAVEKVLAELGLRNEPELTAEQEEMLKRALDPEQEYLYQVKKLFSQDEE